MNESRQLTHVAQLISLRAQTHALHNAIGDGTVRLTYADLANRAGGVARHVRELGVGPGDRVILQGRNRTAWVIAALGVLSAGATVAPINSEMPAAERDRLLAALAPAAVISEEGAGDLAGEVPALSFVEVMAVPPGLRKPLPSEPALDPDLPALVLSSSGTTGVGKQVAMTHRQLMRLYADVTDALGVVESDVMLAVPPLSHSLGFNGILLVALMAGAGVRLVPTYDRAATPALIVDERVTVLSGPPTLFHDLERHIGPEALQGTARLAVVGGQTVLVDELLATGRQLGLREVVVGYGMTEACGTVAVSRIPVDESVGPHLPLQVMPGMEVRIGTTEVPTGHDVPGPILVRGYNVVSAAQIDGWFDTGDLGHLDAQGRLVVVGRSTDRVIVSGFNVHPRDVERVLAAHPAVEQAVVIGVPDQRTGERLVACVVPHGQSLDTEGLGAYAREHLAGYQVPAEILSFLELPLTASGKVARNELLSRVIGTE